MGRVGRNYGSVFTIVAGAAALTAEHTSKSTIGSITRVALERFGSSRGSIRILEKLEGDFKTLARDKLFEEAVKEGFKQTAKKADEFWKKHSETEAQTPSAEEYTRSLESRGERA